MSLATASEISCRRLGNTQAALKNSKLISHYPDKVSVDEPSLRSRPSPTKLPSKLVRRPSNIQSLAKRNIKNSI